jgi:hypothetical protein
VCVCVCVCVCVLRLVHAACKLLGLAMAPTALSERPCICIYVLLWAWLVVCMMLGMLSHTVQTQFMLVRVVNACKSCELQCARGTAGGMS